MSAFCALSERVVIITSSSPRPSLALSTPYTCNFISINALLWLTPLLCNLGYPNVLELTIKTILHHPCQHYPHLPLPSRYARHSLPSAKIYPIPLHNVHLLPRDPGKPIEMAMNPSPRHTIQAQQSWTSSTEAFVFSNFQRLSAMESISPQRWNELAISEGVLKHQQDRKLFGDAWRTC
jgi:hypothetical protein